MESKSAGKSSDGEWASMERDSYAIVGAGTPAKHSDKNEWRLQMEDTVYGGHIVEHEILAALL